MLFGSVEGAPSETRRRQTNCCSLFGFLFFASFLAQRSANHVFPDGLNRMCKHAIVRRILLPVFGLAVPRPPNPRPFCVAFQAKQPFHLLSFGEMCLSKKKKKANNNHPQTTVVFVLRLFCGKWSKETKQKEKPKTYDGSAATNVAVERWKDVLHLAQGTNTMMMVNNNNNIKLMKLPRRKHPTTRR